MKFLFKILLSCAFFMLSSAFAKPILINGAGASFPYILYSKWFYEYSKIQPKARINYRSIGSGGGIRQLVRGTLDFGASDVPMKLAEIKKSKKEILHIPTTLSAVVLTYNLPEVEKPISLSSNLIGKIFDGRITKWNHPELVRMNPALAPISKGIVVIYRADGSGTTAVFTEFLSKTNSEWKIGQGKSIRWPQGVGGKGNEGCLGLVQKIEGAISYIGMSYALKRKLPMARIQNKSGVFVSPTFKSVQLASVQSSNKDFSYLTSIVDPQNKQAYPIASYSFLLIQTNMPAKIETHLVDFLNWALKKGQTYNKKLYYVPLPQHVIKEAQQVINTIKTKS